VRALVATCLALLAAAAPAAAGQRWGRERTPRDGACFYKDPDFRGDYFCVRDGDGYDALPKGMNDEISSIRIFGRVEVTIFKDVRFQGRSSRFGGDVPDLEREGWDDTISSIRVRAGGGGGNRYRGSSADADRAIRRAYEDILNRQPDAEGLRLYRSRMLDDGWSESQVREALRSSPEYREKSVMTYAKAQDIVRRAYLAVLRREPDAGSQGYVERVMRERWTQQDVERELRKSSEYRERR
jgi:hypothetical protein